jgi:hypothetical protein
LDSAADKVPSLLRVRKKSTYAFMIGLAEDGKRRLGGPDVGDHQGGWRDFPDRNHK